MAEAPERPRRVAAIEPSPMPVPVPTAPSAPTAEPSTSPELAVRGALEAWIGATQRGDLAAQMAFYPAVVPIYYTWRNASHEAVLAEKERVFGAAWVLDIRTGAPTVTMASDGDTAVTRFRKAYVIEGPHVGRRGAVVQELRWVRTGAGWKITSERDAVVVASEARASGTLASARRPTTRRPLSTTDASTFDRLQAP